MKPLLASLGAAVCLAFLSPISGHAQTAAPDPAEAHYEKFLHDIATAGPAEIPFRDEAVLDLPAGYAFIPQKAGQQVMHDMGNETDDSFVGLIFPAKRDGWFILVEDIKSGYVKDDDAASWDTGALLDTIRKNTDAANEDRIKQGIPAMQIIGWVEKPHYDASTHRMIWSISSRDWGTHDASKYGVNYRTLMLGRGGYISMVMVTDLRSIEAQKPIAQLLLAKLNFEKGKRYQDFNMSTDRVAEFGLAALVAGVAVKKLGLLAVGIALAVKFAKVILIAVVAGFAVLRKKFSRRD